MNYNKICSNSEFEYQLINNPSLTDNSDSSVMDSEQVLKHKFKNFIFLMDINIWCLKFANQHILNYPETHYNRISVLI